MLHMQLLMLKGARRHRVRSLLPLQQSYLDQLVNYLGDFLSTLKPGCSDNLLFLYHHQLSLQGSKIHWIPRFWLLFYLSCQQKSEKLMFKLFTWDRQHSISPQYGYISILKFANFITKRIYFMERWNTKSPFYYFSLPK